MLSADVPEFVPKALRAKEEAASELNEEGKEAVMVKNELQINHSDDVPTDLETTHIAVLTDEPKEMISLAVNAEETENVLLLELQTDDTVSQDSEQNVPYNLPKGVSSETSLQELQPVNDVEDATHANLVNESGYLAMLVEDGSCLSAPKSILSATSAEFFPATEYNSAIYVDYNTPSESPSPHIPYVPVAANTRPPHSVHAGFIYPNKPPMYYEPGGYGGYYCDPSGWPPDIDYSAADGYYNPMMGASSHYSGGEYYIPNGGYMYDGEGYQAGAAMMMEPPTYYDSAMMQAEYGSGPGFNGMHPLLIGGPGGARGGSNIHSGNYGKKYNKSKNRKPPDHAGGRGGGRQPANEMRICGQTGELTVGKRRVLAGMPQNKNSQAVRDRVQASTIISDAKNWPTLGLGKTDKDNSGTTTPTTANAVTHCDSPTSTFDTQPPEDLGNGSNISFSSIAKKMHDSHANSSSDLVCSSGSSKPAISVKSKGKDPKLSKANENPAHNVPGDSLCHPLNYSNQNKVTSNQNSGSESGTSLEDSKLIISENNNDKADVNLGTPGEEPKSPNLMLENRPTLSKNAKKKAKQKMKKLLAAQSNTSTIKEKAVLESNTEDAAVEKTNVDLGDSTASGCDGSQKSINSIIDSLHAPKETKELNKKANKSKDIKATTNNLSASGTFDKCSINKLTNKKAFKEDTFNKTDVIPEEKEDEMKEFPNEQSRNHAAKNIKSNYSETRKISSNNLQNATETSALEEKPNTSIPKDGNSEIKKPVVSEESEWITVVKRSKTKKNIHYVLETDKMSHANSEKPNNFQPKCNAESVSPPLSNSNDASFSQGKYKEEPQLEINPVSNDNIWAPVSDTAPTKLFEQSILSKTKDPNDPEVQELIRKRALRKENVKREKKLNRESAILQKQANARKDSKISVVKERINASTKGKNVEEFSINSIEYPSLGARRPSKASEQISPKNPVVEIKKLNGIIQSTVKDGAKSATDKSLPSVLKVASGSAEVTTEAGGAASKRQPQGAAQTSGYSVDQEKVLSYSSAASRKVAAAPVPSASSEQKQAPVKTKKKGTVQPSPHSKHVKSSDKVFLDLEALIKVKPGKSSAQGKRSRVPGDHSGVATARGPGGGMSAAKRWGVARTVRVVAGPNCLQREKGKRNKVPTPVQRFKRLRAQHTQDLLLLLADIKRKQEAAEGADINTEGFREGIPATPPVVFPSTSVTPPASSSSGRAVTLCDAPMSSCVKESPLRAPSPSTAAAKKRKRKRGGNDNKNSEDSRASEAATPTAASVTTAPQHEQNAEASAPLSPEKSQEIAARLLQEIVFFEQLQTTTAEGVFCSNVITDGLNQLLASLLEDLVRFQRRQYQLEPLKAKARRRYVCGIKETQKRLHKMQFLIVAPDIRKNIPVLATSLASLVRSAEAASVPVVFGLNRKRLAQLCRTRLGNRVSCVGVLSYQGAEKQYKEIMGLLPELRDQCQSTRRKITAVPVPAGGGASDSGDTDPEEEEGDAEPSSIACASVGGAMSSTASGSCKGVVRRGGGVSANGDGGKNGLTRGGDVDIVNANIVDILQENDGEARQNS